MIINVMNVGKESVPSIPRKPIMDNTSVLNAVGKQTQPIGLVADIIKPI